MPCFHPLRAFKTLGGDVVFAELKRHDIVTRLDLACGRCMGCRLDRAHDWAVRCLHEAQLHKENCFVTLTYEADELGRAPQTLNYDHFRLFIKRTRHWARRALPRLESGPRKLRFYMCGEYGEQLDRPHYHACLFGIDFPDKRVWSETKGTYTSETLEQLWGHGFCTIGAITYESASYTARYITDKITGDLAEKHYEYIDHNTGEIKHRKPQFNKMSLKPGIGANWIDRFTTDVYPHGAVVVNGRETRPPKYYDKRFKKTHPDDYEDLAWQRERRALENHGERTEERLKVRETVLRARFNLKSRHKT